MTNRSDSRDRGHPGNACEKGNRRFRLPRTILWRTAVLSWIVIAFTVAVFAVSILPAQRRNLLASFRSEAEVIAVSIDQVTASSIVLEDYSFVVEHCLRVVQENPSVVYVVVTRKDGFSLVHLAGEWRQAQLSGRWAPAEKKTDGGVILRSDLAGKDVYHYSHRFAYSGLDWGWIHIGLSLDRFNADLRAAYERTVWLALACLVCGFAVSLFFARRLSRPIQRLNQMTRRVGKGDLSARVDISTGDEVESLAHSFNRMTETLQRSQEETIATRDYAEGIVESMTDMLIVIDADANIRKVNKAACDTLGYDRRDLIGQPAAAIFADGAIKRGGILKVVEDGSPANQETALRAKDGRRIAALLAWSVMSGHKGETMGIVGIAKNITEQKRLEDQLRQSQKMEAVGLLAGGVAHDFNNLLQAISGHAELAMGAPPASQAPVEDLKEIQRAASKGASLTRQLLAFSRRQVLQPKELNLNQAVSDLMMLLRRVIGEDVELVFHPASGLGTVRADPGQIEQVLMNLCVNARDAMSNDGRISIETQNATIDETFCRSHPYAKEGAYVMVSVTDTGVGMAREVAEHIFEPFFTTKEVGKGAGLGLATVYGIVQQHDGVITVTSEPGQGTTFKVYLPRTESGMEREAVLPGAAERREAIRGGTETILIAEDEEIVRNLLQAILEEAGYKVLVAADGQEAARLFEQNACAISLALLDVVMPKMNGREVHHRIKAIKPGVKILFSSGYSADAIHTSFILDEGLDLLQKPYNRKVILTKVREILDRRHSSGM